jgi:ribosomal protein S18 acetylase RimI-like enzyme
MSSQASIRHAVVTDASDISKLIASTSETCCFSEAAPCPDWYLNSIQTQAIATLIASDRMVFLLAVNDQAIAGILAIEGKSSIKYFFVHPAQQKMGIGQLLWQFAKNSGAFGETLKVRSSLFAVHVYERLGFEAVGPPSCFNGLHFQSMVTHKP